MGDKEAPLPFSLVVQALLLGDPSSRSLLRQMRFKSMYPTFQESGLTTMPCAKQGQEGSLYTSSWPLVRE